MLGFVFDIISFLRFGYIVLCMIVGIGVVVGFCIKIVKKVFKIKTVDEKWIDEVNKRSYQFKTDEADDRSSDIYFAVGRAGQTGYSGQPINIDKGGKDE